MKNFHKLDEYDIKLLQDARQRIMTPYEYHYGDSKMRNEINRLDTIIRKLDELIEINNKEKEK